MATKAVSLELPEELLVQAQQIADRDQRSLNEVFAEAFSRYQSEKWWDEINAYGRAKAEAAGIRTEEDVVRLVKEVRREMREEEELGDQK